jgi:hypothetical protein
MTPLESEILKRAIAKQYGPTATLANISDYLLKKDGAGPLQEIMKKDVARLASVVPGVNNKNAVRIGRFAGRLTPALAAVGNVADVANVITGEESLGNKTMDTAAMGAGGALGFMVGGPLGASFGASLGKMGSDGMQYLFGDKLTPEQRKMREALMMLQGGRY